MILTLGIHHSRVDDLEYPGHLMTSPALTTSGHRDLFGNWCTRFVAAAGHLVLWSDALIRDDSTLDDVSGSAPQMLVERLRCIDRHALRGAYYARRQAHGAVR